MHHLPSPFFAIAFLAALFVNFQPVAGAAELTAADLQGPDGIVYPDFSRAGVTGAIPPLPVTVKASDHGLPTDGHSDASMALNAAIAEAARLGGGAVLIPKGRYILDGTLKITHHGVVLRGADRDKVVLVPRFQNHPSNGGTPAVISVGRDDNPKRLDAPLTMPVKRGQTEVAVSNASRFQPGDRVVLNANPPVAVVDALSDEGRAHIQEDTYGAVYSHQYFLVKSVTAERVELDRPLRLDLDLDQKPVLRRVTMVQGSGVENLSILQHLDKKKIHGIRLNQTADCWVRGVTMHQIGDWPLGINRSMNFEIRDSDFDQSRSRGGARAYFGISFSSDGLVDGCRITRFRHLSPQLTSNGNVFRNCEIRNVDINFHFHWPYENLFENCEVDAGAEEGEELRGSYGFGIYTPHFRGGGHNPAGPRNVFYNNTITSNWDGLMLGGGGTFGTIVAYNLFDVRASTGAVIKPGSDGSILHGNTFVLRDPHRRRPSAAYGIPDVDKLHGAVIFTEGIPPGIRATANRFYGAPREGVFAPAPPAVDENNKISSSWPVAAGASPEGTVPLAGPWRIVETVRLPSAPSPEEAHPDPGISEAAIPLLDPELDDSDWNKVDLPAMLTNDDVDWETYDGEIIVRRTFDLPETLQDRDLLLSLGAIDDHDTTWINGVEVGANSGSDAWRTPRNYKVPASALKPRDNVIVIRVWDSFGGGGFFGIPGDMWMGPPESSSAIRPPSKPHRSQPPAHSLLEWQKSQH